MKSNKTLLLSIFLTVFLLVIGGGVATAVLANNSSPAQNTISAADAIKVYQARETQYQALLSQANQELEKANQKILALSQQVSTFTAENSTAEPEYAISAEMAGEIASQTAQAAPLASPELVSYNNIPAYEVKFENGMIYVDANNGQILFNGLQAATIPISADQAVRIAVQYLGNPNFSGIAVGLYNGSQVYIVSFTNGQKAYVDAYGQIIAIQMPPTSSSSSSGEEESESEHDD